MTPNQPIGPAASELARAVLIGAFLGMILSVTGVVWTAWGEGVSVDLGQVRSQGMFATLGGAVVGFVLYLTRSYRARGTIQHYCSWILASSIAVFVLISPDLREEGWTRSVLFSLFLGVCFGLGLGAGARQWSQNGW